MHVNFQAGCFPFPSGFFDTPRQFYIPSLTYFPIFSPPPPDNHSYIPQLTYFIAHFRFSTTSILTLDTLALQRKGVGSKKAPSFWDQASLCSHVPARSGQPGTGLGDMDFAHVSFSLVGGSESKIIGPYYRHATGNTHFCP